MVGQPLQNVSQPGPRVDVIELGGLDQAVEGRRAFSAAIRAGEQVVLAPDRHLLVILPISGRKSWSIIAGIPSTGVAFASAAASSVSPGGSCRSKRSPASSRLWRRGCSIRSRAQVWRSAPAGYRWTRSSNCIDSSASEEIGEAPRTTRSSSRRSEMENHKTGPAPATAPRQLSLALDSVTLRGISPPERTVIIVRLARILLEAAGVPMRERDDERR